MDRETVKKWAARYDEGYPIRHEAIEDYLHESLNEQGYITRGQLRKVVRWKLDGQPGRRARFLDSVEEVPDEYIRRISEAAFLVDDPEIQIDSLSSIPGIGDATATVILAFYDPADYGVADQYMVDALLGEQRQMRKSDYPDLLAEYRDQNPGGFDLRTVEKAHYQQYFVEQNTSE